MTRSPSAKPAARPASLHDGPAIRIGIGGWEFPPWRETFYPPGLKAKDRLAHVGRVLTATEINATFHKTQSPESFAKWAAETPDGFTFAVKAQRGTTHRTTLAEAAPSIAHFLASGIDRLGDKLGPVLWQLAHNKRFDPADFAAFLGLLPKAHGGVPLRHAIEAQHASFACAEAVALLRAHGVARVVVDTPDAPPFADVTSDIVYVRLKGSLADEPDGYPAAELGRWAARLGAYAAGRTPDDLPRLAEPAPVVARRVYAFVIAGAKERAPAAAQALRGLIEGAPTW